MTKKQIFWICIAALVVVILVCLHFFPLWVSGVSVIGFASGCIVGWAGKTWYDKYIKPIKDIQDKV